MTLITNISFAASQRFYTYNAIHSFREAAFIVERIIVSVRLRLATGYPPVKSPETVRPLKSSWQKQSLQGRKRFCGNEAANACYTLFTTDILAKSLFGAH